MEAAALFAIAKYRKVEIAGYAVQHALISQPRIVIKAKNGKKALLDAAERLHKQSKDMTALFKKLK